MAALFSTGPVFARGALAELRLARLRGTDGPWLALKRPRPDRGAPAVAHVRAEAALLSRLVHPGIVEVRAADASAAVPFVATVYLPGGDLRRRTGTAAAIARCLAPAAAALDWLHAQGHVHADIKPANLVLDMNGGARLIDFGAGMSHATPGFAAPERWLGLAPDPRDDVFSLAAVIWTWLAGRAPFGSDPVLHLADAAPPPGLPTRAWPCLRAALSPARRSRPRTAGEVVAGRMPRVNDPRIARATGSLPQGAPDPAEAREGERYAELEAAIHRMEREGPSAIDWADVARTAEAYLATDAKDLTVAAWLVVALARTQGLLGIAVGLGILTGLLSSGWESLYPPPARLRARQGVLSWLADTLAPLIPADGPDELVASATDDLAALDALLRERMPPDGIAFTEARRRLRTLRETAAARHVSPPPAAPRASVAAQAAPAQTPAQRLVAIREDARRMALAMQQEQPADPRSYALLRALTWIEVAAAPDHTAGATGVPPPAVEREAEFAAMREAGDLGAMIAGIERMCSDTAIFWLDGQRLSHAALCDRGEAYAGCAEAVRLGVRALLARLPSLPDLAFAGGRPFADPATQSWIRTVVNTTEGAERDAPAAPPWQAGAAQARSLSAAGKREEALASLDAAARGAPDGRARFFWRLAEARHCLDAGLAGIALSLARELDETILRQGLEAWEPDAARDALRLYYDCIVTKNSGILLEDADRTTARDALLARLARLDPVLAARLAGSFRKSR